VSSARDRAQAEWARVQERPAIRDRFQRFNDGSLELAIAVARSCSLLGVVASSFVLLPVAAVFADWRLWLTTGIYAVASVGIGYWGWWHYGNPEWKRKGGKGGSK